MSKKLTFKDMPKDALVAALEASGINIPQGIIAGAIIESRIAKACKFAGQYESTVAEMDKTRSAVKRRGLNVTARRQIYNAKLLFESARRMADAYRLTGQYFSDGKKEAGAATPAFNETQNDKRRIANET